MSSTVVSPFTMHRARLQEDLLAHYDELIARTSWQREQIRNHQRERLRSLLRHAATHSRFHAGRLRGIDLDGVGPDDLSALPVMTKADLMASFDDVVTDERITLERAEAALADVEEEPATLLDSVLVLATGGSSGPRGVFVLDPPAVRQFLGSLSRGLVARIRAMGGPPPGGLPLAMVAARSPVHATAAAIATTAGGALPFHFEPVPVTLPVPEMVERLDRIQPAALYGYPTVLAQLAAEQTAGRLHIRPMAVTSTSETCTPELRAAIRAGFPVPLVDTFGSTEGLVGSTPPDDDVFVFAEDGCIVELVDADDRPVPPGTPSAAVLVTALENHLQPLIRYRLTDTFVEQPPVTAHGYLRARVEGRSDDVLRFGGVSVHPLVIRSVLVHAPEVVDYRVRQTARGIAVDALAPHGTDGAALQAGLAAALAGTGLDSPEVSVDVVAELPRDPDSGKLRRFVPLT
jgi:phenylacetate-coenzyme A ligase PaaK-like adenylate-forming protein